MSGTLKVLAGPAGSGKTTHLIEHCREAAGKGSVLWLCPSLRRAEQLRTRLGGIPGLLLLTFTDLAGELLAHNRPELRPLARSQARLIADEVIGELHAAHQLGHFARVAETRGFSEGVVGLLGELQRQGITPESFEAAAGDSAKLRQLAAIYALYRKRLTALALCDADERETRAAEVLRKTPQASPLHELHAVYVDDFYRFTPPQLDLLGCLASVCEETWVSLPDEDGDVRAELFTVSRRTKLLPPLSPILGGEGSDSSSPLPRSGGERRQEREDWPTSNDIFSGRPVTRNWPPRPAGWSASRRRG